MVLDYFQQMSGDLLFSNFSTDIYSKKSIITGNRRTTAFLKVFTLVRDWGAVDLNNWLSD